MPWFHINLRRRAGLTLDEEGGNYAGIEEALLAAYRSAQELCSHFLLSREDVLDCSFEITDGTGAVVDVLPFGEVIGGAQRNPSAQAKASARMRRGRNLSDQIGEELRVLRERLDATRALLARSQASVQRFRTISGEAGGAAEA